MKTQACAKNDHELCYKLGASVYPATYPNPLAESKGPCKCDCHKIAVLDALAKENNTIVTTEQANKIGLPFGMIFETHHYSPNRYGVEVHLIAGTIANEVLGSSREYFLDRETQFRSDIAESRKALIKGITGPLETL